MKFPICAACLFSVVLSSTTPALGQEPRARTLWVGGKMVDIQGEPIAGVEVSIERYPSPFETDLAALEGNPSEPVATAWTDGSGEFRVAIPEPGMWLLTGSARGRERVAVQLAPLLRARQLLPIVLDRAEAKAVTIKSADGQPIRNALIVAQAEQPRPLRSTLAREPSVSRRQTVRTNEEGRAELLAPRNGTLGLTIGAPGYLTTHEPLHGRRATIELVQGIEKKILVRDAQGQPMVAATVGAGSRRLPVARTDDQGLASVAVPRVGETLVTIEAAGGAIGRSFVSANTEEPVAIDVRLEILGGQVLAREGRVPIQGALVWSVFDPSRFAKTGKDGGYRLEVARHGRGRPGSIGAIAEGFFSQNAAVTPDRLEKGEGPTLLLEAGRRVIGIVTDVGGKPVAGATVGARLVSSISFGSRQSTTTRSAEDGRFELGPLDKKGSYELVARHDGYSPARQQLEPLAPGKAAEIRLILPTGRRAFGQVVDDSEQPVAGAEVTLGRSFTGGDLRRMVMVESRGQDDSLRALTGSDGTFELRDLEPGRFDLRVEARGFAPARVPAVEIPDSDQSNEIGIIALEPGVVVQGYVVDADDLAIAGAEVRVKERAGGVFNVSATRGHADPAAVSGEDGFFEIGSLAVGQPIEIDVERQGYAPTRLSAIKPPTIEPLEVRMEAASRLRGIVVNELGEPIPSAAVRLARQTGSQAMSPTTVRNMMRSAFAGEDGRFELEDIRNGTWEIAASGPGYLPGTVTGIEVVAGTDPEPLELVLEEGARLEGRVLGADSKPLADARVSRVISGQRSFSFSSAMSPSSETTDAEGNYWLDGLPTGVLTFSVDHEEHQKLVRDLEIEPGDNKLDFRLERGLEISGLVITDTGVPVANAQVEAKSPSDSFATLSLGLSGAVTGADGSFVLTGLSDGDYVVAAYKSGYAMAKTDDAVRLQGTDARGIELRLESGAAIAGRILGLGFDELSRVQIFAMQPGAGSQTIIGQADYEGAYRLENLRYGDWTVTVSVGRSGRSARETVTLEPGMDELQLDFELDGGLVLSGQVLRAQRPVTGASVTAIGTRTTSGSRSRSDHQGRFRLEGLDEGTYRVAVLALGGRRHEQEVELSADRDIVIELSESKISGRVADQADGSPIEGVTLSLLPLDPETSARFSGGLGAAPRSDARGAFTLHGIAPGGYSLSARKQGYSTAMVEIEVAESADLEGVEIEMSASRGITLFVLEPSGASASRVNLIALDANERPVISGSYATSEGGRLHLDELPEGRWTVLVSSSGAALERRVTAPSAPVTLRLPESGRLRLSVPALVDRGLQAAVVARDPAGRIYRVPRSRGVQQRFDLIDGRAFLTLPVGAWSLEVTVADESQSWTTSVQVVADRALEAVIE